MKLNLEGMIVVRKNAKGILVKYKELIIIENFSILNSSIGV